MSVLGSLLLGSPRLPARFPLGLARVALNVLRIAARMTLSAMLGHRVPHQRLCLVSVDFASRDGAVQLGPDLIDGRASLTCAGAANQQQHGKQDWVTPHPTPPFSQYGGEPRCQRDLAQHRRAVGLQRQEVVAAAIEDDRGGAVVGVYRVAGDEKAVEGEGLEQRPSRRR